MGSWSKKAQQSHCYCPAGRCLGAPCCGTEAARGLQKHCDLICHKSPRVTSTLAHIPRICFVWEERSDFSLTGKIRHSYGSVLEETSMVRQMLIADEKWSIRTGKGPSSEVVNNPSAFLAVKQKSVFVQWSAEENSTGATWGMQRGSQGEG